MWERIQANLTRQAKGLDVLKALLKEEFSLLAERRTREVSSLEFSIHELLRQLVVEREEVRALCGKRRIRERLVELPEDQAAFIEGQLQVVDRSEQLCARQASRNSELVLALYDQSRDLLDFMHRQITPETKETYSKKGRYAQARPDAALVRGHL